MFIWKHNLNWRFSPSIPANSDFTVYYMARNGTYFSLKNHGLLQRCIVATYGLLHDVFRKPFRLTRKQRELARKGRRDGHALFKESRIR